MALQKTMNIKCDYYWFYSGNKISSGERDLTLSDAYIKVTKASGNKELVSMSVSISSNDMEVDESYTFIPNMDGGNFIKQGYEYLKTLDAFIGAVDC